MLGHCYLDGKYTFWFYSFHMTLFFFLSGYTFSEKQYQYRAFLVKKIRTLVIPYFFFAIITMLCNGFLTVTHGNSYDIASVVIQYILQVRYTLLWYIACLFVAEQIIFFLLQIKTYNKHKWLIYGSLLLMVFAVYRTIIDIDLFWNADLAILAAAVMCFGICYRSCNIDRISTKKGIEFWLVCISISWLNYQIFGRTDWFSNMFGNPILFVIAAASVTAAILALSQRFSQPKLACLGKNSLLFFALHRIIIDLTFVFYGKIGIEIKEGSIQSLIMAMVSVAVAVVVLIPVNNFVTTFVPWGVGKKIRS